MKFGFCTMKQVLFSELTIVLKANVLKKRIGRHRAAELAVTAEEPSS